MNDTLIFLLPVGIAVLFKWLTSLGSGDPDSEEQEPPSPNEQRTHPPPESEEERVRRFLEALGQPPGTKPPPPVRPRTRVEPRAATPPQQPPQKVKRSWVQPLPPLTTVPPPLPTPVAPIEPSVTPTPARPPAQPPVPSRATKAVTTSPAASFSLGKLLHSRADLRQAVVLREILGPPRGLEAFQ